MPWKLWVAVSGLLSLDLALLIIWFAVDPLVRQVHNFPKIPSENPEEDVEIQPQMEHCKSQHHTVWLGKLKTKRPEHCSRDLILNSQYFNRILNIIIKTY